MRFVTHEDKNTACNSPLVPWDYNVLKWHHRNAWSNEVTTTKFE